MENPVYDINKEENNEPETFDGFVDFSIYGISKGESMDLETWENPSMEEEHSKLLYDQSESYHAEPHKCINNEDIETQCCEKLDVMQSVEYQSQPSSSHRGSL